ncbi:hypothetical protein I6E84_08160 [Psychrobacter sp. SCQQ22]|uniref:hypothetical protein n=1 Tax=unclassified Psychrobacter TaxID=196806 RepID=UPI0018CFAE7A|nr:hypothetical protein [Psychrobacter sp. SCQQ22]MBH0086190.1 hypothetical protein [Psychrobacter sp. SCQQ22]
MAQFNTWVEFKIMIRALSKNDSDFIYIYSVYESKNYSENKVETYYLASCSNYQGLMAYRESEVYNIEILADNYVSLTTVDLSAGLNDRMHPILYDFLKNDWDAYEGIVEGQLKPWLEFQKELGHRP